MIYDLNFNWLWVWNKSYQKKNYLMCIHKSLIKVNLSTYFISIIWSEQKNKIYITFLILKNQKDIFVFIILFITSHTSSFFFLFLILKFVVPITFFFIIFFIHYKNQTHKIYNNYTLISNSLTYNLGFLCHN